MARKLKGFISLLVIFSIFPLFSSASDPSGLVNCTGTGCDFCNFIMLLEKSFYFLLSVSFATALFFIIVYGLFYLSSFFRSGYLKIAKRGLKFSLIGFSVCLLAWLLIHTLYSLLGYNQTSWWKIECNPPIISSNAENRTEEQNPDQIQYANEVLLNGIGGRNNPVRLEDLSSLILDKIPQNKYFFLHGLGGQPLDDSAKQIITAVKQASEKKSILYTVLPKNTFGSGSINVSQFVNLNNYIGSNSSQTTKNIKQLISELVSDSPTTEIPVYLGEQGKTPSQFNNLWPKNIYQNPNQAIKTITKDGLVYIENKPILSSDEIKTDLSYVTFNFNYDAKKDNYSLNKDNPITFNFPPNISQETAQKATESISQVVADTVLNKSYTDDSLQELAGTIVKDVEMKQKSTGEMTDLTYNSGILPTGLVKDATGTVEDTLAFSSQMAQMAKQIIQKENSSSEETGIISEVTSKVTKAYGEAENLAPNIPTLPTLPEPPAPNNGTLYNPKAPSAPTPESLQDPTSIGATNKINEDVQPTSSSVTQTTSQETNNPSGSTVAERVSAVDNYDISDLKYRVSTDRILTLEEREQIRGMLEGVRKEIAENGKDLNIPTDFAMCFFQYESKFDAGAMSSSGCSGIGQMCMNDSKDALKQMEKYAPEHFKELSDKVARDGKGDLKKIIMSENFTKKRELLRSDPNLSAALSYALLDFKKRGTNGNGKPIGNDNDLVSLADRYGPGKETEPNYGRNILNCYKNNAWKKLLQW